MCGVFGYTGTRPDAAATVVRGLQCLEYRGYDSWGVAVVDDRGLDVEKQVGRIGGAVGTRLKPARIGVGHTRWATHGRVTVANAHPHTDCRGRLAVVHNGIVENHQTLRTSLEARGHRFASETDTEVIVHLLEDELQRDGQGRTPLVDALRRVDQFLEGSSAVVVLDAVEQRLVALRHGSPLLLGLAGDTTLVASDAAALLPHTRDVVFLHDGQIATARGGDVRIADSRTGESLTLCPQRLDWSPQAAERGAYPHFMLKEIAEQPAQWRRWADSPPEQVRALARAVAAAQRLVLLGCGTAYHAALAGGYMLATLAGRTCQVAAASEVEPVLPEVHSGTLCVALSQSGETADVLDAVHQARQRGATVAALVNAPGSSLSRLADLTVPLGAGPESCVLATKSFTAKLAALLHVAAALARCQPRACADLRQAAELGGELLGEGPHGRITALAAELARHDHVYVLGRGQSFPVALEAALKIKEGSYVHAEGFAGGELKHGVIALIEPGTPCLVLAPRDTHRATMLSGAAEVSARGALVAGLSGQRDGSFDRWVPVGEAGTATPLVQTLACQLLSYEIALARGVDPDRPRNLAKSVTVK